jgi:hypothetical protein
MRVCEIARADIELPQGKNRLDSNVRRDYSLNPETV